MKQIYPYRFFIFTVLLLLRLSASAQITSPYVTIWQTDISGITGSNTIRIPAQGEFAYLWEQVGNTSNSGAGTGINTTDISFPSPGIYQVSMTPTGTSPFNRINFDVTSNYNVGGDRDKLIDIKQWGDVHWASLETAYFFCSNLTLTASDLPDLNNVTSMRAAFSNAGSLLATNAGSWNVSNVTDISSLFSGTQLFNQDIGGWDVANVTDMHELFYFAMAFNQNLNSWNVSSVNNMNLMFDYAMKFNGNISSWDVSNVTDMGYMFNGAQEFNQNINNWNVSKVSNMEYMFSGATMFNQSLSKWTLTNLTTAATMFQSSAIDCQNYTQTLYGWAQNTNTPSNIYIGYSAPLRYGPDAVQWRSYLINTKGWTIQNDQEDPSCMVVLPVRLVSFDVIKSEHNSLLKWKTASEYNSSHFEIEKSVNAKKFEYVASVVAHGFTEQQQTYTFLHDSPSSGINYYRLKQIDSDGKFAYSQIRTIRFDETPRLILYPNPTSDHFLISGYTGKGDVHVYDISGRLIFKQNSVSENTPISTKNLSHGQYNILFIKESGTSTTLRLLKTIDRTNDLKN